MTAERERISPGQPEPGLIERSPRERAIESYMRLADLLFSTPDNQLNEQIIAEKRLLGELVNLDTGELRGETIKNLSTNRTFQLAGPPSGKLLVFARGKANGVIGNPLSPEDLETLRSDIQIVQSNSKDAAKVVKEERWTSVEAHVSQTRERLGLPIDPLRYRVGRDVYNYWVFVPPRKRAEPSPRVRQAQAPAPSPRAERLHVLLRRQFERAGRETLQYIRERRPRPLHLAVPPRREVLPPPPQYMVVIANRTSELKKIAIEAATSYLKRESGSGNIFNNFRKKVIWGMFEGRMIRHFAQQAEKWLIQANDIYAPIDWRNQRAVSTKESRAAEYFSALGKTEAIQHQSRYIPPNEGRVEITGPLRQELVDTLVERAVGERINPLAIQQELRNFVRRHSNDPWVRIFEKEASYFATDLFLVAQQIRQDLIRRRISVEEIRRTLQITFVNPHWGIEGSETQQLKQNTRSAGELLDAFSLGWKYGVFNLGRTEGRRLLILSLTEIRARLDFSRSHKIDLVTYRSRYEVEHGRAALERTVSQGIAALQQSGMTETDFYEEWKKAIATWKKRLEDDAKHPKPISDDDC